MDTTRAGTDTVPCELAQVGWGDLGDATRRIFEDLPLGVALLNRRMEVLLLNRQMREWFGGADVSKKPTCHQVLRGREQDGPCPDCPVTRTMADGGIHESIIRTESGDSPWRHRVVSAPLLDDDGRAVAFLVTHEDVTERVLAEEAMREYEEGLEELSRRLQENQTQLVQSEKMASLGQLAAGVAHEINNPVGFVMSNLGTLKEYIGTFKELIGEYGKLADAVEGGRREEGRAHLAAVEAMREKSDLDYIWDDVDQLLSESAEGMGRVKEIVQGLRSFARLDEGQLKEANINDGIEATLKVVWNELKYKCQVFKKLGDLPPIRCYLGELNQVFMNLLVNAAQAMEDHGEITIETAATDTHVVVRISDTGSGIAPENVSKLFTPFFTTKPVGKGTGLGLSISYGIVKKHNGTIEAESEVGKGTTFIIRLPIQGPSCE